MLPVRYSITKYAAKEAQGSHTYWHEKDTDCNKKNEDNQEEVILAKNQTVKGTCDDAT